MCQHVLRQVAVAAILMFSACGSPPVQESNSSTSEPPQSKPAPWSAARLPRSDVPDVYRAQWAKAENRAKCALLVPASLGDGKGAVPRAATFSGGWAVAYDRNNQRSAFGIAGSGSEPDSTTYDAWPNKVRWADGSSAGYGPEGGTGPSQLAYVRVAGQQCLYNVWSRLGLSHLEFLLTQLRFVEP